jgi:hypothetical protein
MMDGSQVMRAAELLKRRARCAAILKACNKPSVKDGQLCVGEHDDDGGMSEEWVNLTLGEAREFAEAIYDKATAELVKLGVELPT